MRKKLLEQRAAAIARCDELSAIRETRELTEAEQVEFRSTLDKAKQLGEDILAAEELDRERAEQQVAEQRAAAAPAQQRPNSAPGHLEVHDNAEDVPFPDFGDFLRAVQVNATERTMDPRLRKSDIRNPQVRAAAGMNEEVASSGGFLVMTEIGAMIEKAAFETGMLASKTTKIPLGPNSNGMKLPGIDETSRVDGSRWGGVRGYWLNEAGSLTSSKPKFRNIELGLNKLAVLVYATDEMLADATTLGSVIQRSASEEFGFKLDGEQLQLSKVGSVHVVLHRPLEGTIKTLQDHVKGIIAPYKYPRAVEFVDSLPKTETGKLQRFKLRAQSA